LLRHSKGTPLSLEKLWTSWIMKGSTSALHTSPKKTSRVLHLFTVNLCTIHGSCQPPPECGQPKAFCRFLSLSPPLSLSTLYNRFKELMAGCPKPFYTALQAPRTRHHAGNKFVGAGCRTLALPASAFSAPGAR